MAPGSFITLHNLVAFTFVLTSVQLAKTVRVELELEDEDKNQFPVQNSNVRLACNGDDIGHWTFSKNPHTGVRVIWTKDDQSVAEWPTGPNGTETPTKYQLSADLPHDNTFYVQLVIIHFVDTTDNGVYRCQLQRVESVEILVKSNEERLTVEQRPASQYPKCFVRPVVNKKSFICDSERGSPPVSLQWWKDGQPLEQVTTDDDLEDFVQARMLVADDESSRGKFECALTFRGKLTGSCILDRPNVTIPTTTSGLSIGQNLVVVCVTSGKPPVSTVDWNFTPDLHLSIKKEGHVLTVNNISSRDNGTRITCEGHNAVGSNQASTVITLRPLEATVQPITVQLEQTKIPTSVDEQAQFKCITTPARVPPFPCVWHYNDHYIDPSNITDRFLVEDRSQHVLLVSGVSTLDVGASVSCRIVVSYHPNAKIFLQARFPQTTMGMTVKTTIQSAPKSTPTQSYPKSSTSETLPFSTLMGYIIGGLMCLVLVGICCLVFLKAKKLLHAKRDPKNSRENETGTKASCYHLNDDLVVDLRRLPEPLPRPLVSTKVLDKEESLYQGLEDVSRQSQILGYQRFISNDWALTAPELSQK